MSYRMVSNSATLKIQYGKYFGDFLSPGKFEETEVNSKCYFFLFISGKFVILRTAHFLYKKLKCMSTEMVN